MQGKIFDKILPSHTAIVYQKSTFWDTIILKKEKFEGN